MAPILFLVGAALVVAGVALLTIPGAIIAAGVGLMAAGFDLGRSS